MTGLRVQPDAVYDKKKVGIRFTVDGDMPPHLFTIAAREAIKQGIARWILVNKKDTFLDREPIRVKRSPFQGDSEKLHEATTTGGRPLNYQDRFLKDGLVDYVAEVWFSGPLIWVEKPEFRQSPGEAEGFAKFDSLNEDYKDLIKDKYRVAATALEKESE